MNVKLTAADIRAAHEAYLRGEDKLVNIGARYGVVPAALHKAFRRHNLPRRPRRLIRLPLTAEELAEARRRADAGQSLTELAYDYALSLPTLTRRLRESGYETDRRKRRSRTRNGSSIASNGINYEHPHHDR